MVPRVIFLVGLPGSGKTTAGQILAARLGWAFADSDREVERAAGRTIPEIFSSDGEGAFRELEAAALARLSTREPIVVATGGGAPTNEDSRRILSNGFCVWLSVSPEEAARRVDADTIGTERPLLAGGTLERLSTLLEARAEVYRAADAAVDVDELTPESVATEIELLWDEYSRAHQHDREPRDDESELPPQLQAAAVVRTPTATYPVIVADGAFEHIGDACRDAGLKGRAFLISDQAVGPLFVTRAEQALKRAEYEVATFLIPPGEAAKTLRTVETVYDFLLEHRVERSDFVVSLGGGVVTDLAGYAAATCLRGIDFIHVPTSLLAMADAAIGGKTGVDHPRGKNMIGAFAQPRAVVIDPLLLRTLPERHLRNGWAELIKHGLILDERLVRDLEFEAKNGPPMMSAELIARSVAIKADVVSDDEREAGRRTLLNYGHTIGHAIEQVTRYSTYLHGEAIAVGMRVAGMISVELGLLSDVDFARQQSLLGAFGLPEAAPGLSVDAVLDATRSDKKVRAGNIRWVLLEGIGNAITHDSVPDEVVHAAVEAVLQ